MQLCVSVCPHLSQGNGPLAEIEFWRERNATLSALYEQTKLPFVRKVLEVIKEAESMLTANVHPILTELFKLHMEASDNVRFLSTVERHFKVWRTGCVRGSQLYEEHCIDVIFLKLHLGAGVEAQLRENLPSTHKALVSIPRTT